MPKDSRKTPDKKIVKDRKELFKFLDEVMNQPFKNDIWITGYIAIELFADFKSWFTNVEAAGGIVKNSEGKFLFIKRWDIWDLPKGKIETKLDYLEPELDADLEDITMKVEDNGLALEALEAKMDSLSRALCGGDRCLLNLSGCMFNNPKCGPDFTCIDNVCELKPGCTYNNPACREGYKCVENVCERDVKRYTGIVNCMNICGMAANSCEC